MVYIRKSQYHANFWCRHDSFAKLYSFTWFLIICNQNSQSKKKKKTSSYIIRCKTWDDVLKQHRAAISKNKKTNSGLVKKEKLGAWSQGLKRCAAKKISASLYKLSFNFFFFFFHNKYYLYFCFIYSTLFAVNMSQAI